MNFYIVWFLLWLEKYKSMNIVPVLTLGRLEEINIAFNFFDLMKNFLNSFFSY